MLHGEPTDRRRRCACARRAPLELTVIEGKYHQVKRMVAAAGNRCEALHRERIGGLRLPRRSPKARGNGSTKPTSDLYGAGKPVTPL